jgi:hypothetical protein
MSPTIRRSSGVGRGLTPRGCSEDGDKLLRPTTAVADQVPIQPLPALRHPPSLLYGVAGDERVRRHVSRRD